MTGYTVHTGTSKKFVAGWDRIFSGKQDDGGRAKPKKGNKKKVAGTKQGGKAADEA